MDMRLSALRPQSAASLKNGNFSSAAARSVSVRALKFLESVGRPIRVVAKSRNLDKGGLLILKESAAQFLRGRVS